MTTLWNTIRQNECWDGGENSFFCENFLFLPLQFDHPTSPLPFFPQSSFITRGKYSHRETESERERERRGVEVSELVSQLHRIPWDRTGQYCDMQNFVASRLGTTPVCCEDAKYHRTAILLKYSFSIHISWCNNIFYYPITLYKL